MNHKILTLVASMVACAFAAGQSLSDLGNDPAYPTQMYVVGVGSSPVSQADADNQAVSQVQKQLTVTVKVNQESGVAQKRQGNKEDIKRWLDSRTTMNSRGDIQGAEIVKRFTKDKNFIAVAALSKTKFAMQKRLNMKEAAKALQTLAGQAKADADANKLADALSARSRIEERIRYFESERLLLSAVEVVTDADTLPVNMDALNKVFGDALKKLSIEVVSGGDQALTDPAQPLQPWVVKVTAGGTPISEMPLQLVSPERKVMRNAVTDAQGMATFYPDAFANRAAGEQVWKVMADLNVARAQVDLLERKRADFRFTVTPIECKVKMVMTGVAPAAKAEIAKALGNYGFRDDGSAKKSLEIGTSVLEKGYSQGLSQASSFYMNEVSLALTVKDAAGRTVHSTVAKAVGAGSKESSIVNAISKMQLGPDASALSKAACGDGSPSKPLASLAILPFSAPRNWYSDEAKAGLLADMVGGAIHRMEAYQLVERTRLNEILQEQTAGQTGMIADPVQMGQLLGAQFVMMGTLLGDWSNIKVEGKIVDTKTGVVVKTFSAAGVLETIADQIAKQVL